MNITHIEIALIRKIDKRVKKMIAIGYQDKEILSHMIDYVPQIQEMLSSNDEVLMELYISCHIGFAYYINLIGNLAVSIANGRIKVANY
jgi:hypothetical protein